jgi:hypothetical protein
MLKQYIKRKNLKENEYLFKFNPQIVNRYMKRVAERLFGDKVSKARGKYNQLSMYDLRHCSVCYWLPRYKSESALKYRLGWKKSDMIHYYSEFLNMKDTISQEDLLIDINATELQNQLSEEKQQRQLLEEQLKSMEDRIKDMQENFAKEMFKKLTAKFPKEKIMKAP